MIKLGEFVVILVTMIVVLQFIGVETGLGEVISNFNVDINATSGELVTADIGNSTNWGYILGVLIAIAGVGSIVIGFFAKGYDPSLVVLPIITTTAILFMSTFWSVIQYVMRLDQPWMTGLVATIFIALGVAFIWSCIDYFRSG